MAKTPSYLPVNYAAAVAQLGNRDAKKIGNNTVLEVLGTGVIGIRYHATTIVTFYDTGQVILTSGGYQTATTKSRLHYVASHYGYRVSQRDFSWYLGTLGSTREVAWRDGVNVAAP